MFKSFCALFLLLSISLSISLSGQQNSDFNFLLDKAVKKVYQNPDEGINFCQSIILNDKDEIHQLILQHLISQAYTLKGEYLQSVKFSLGTTTGEQKEISAFSKLFLDYSLAEQYQNLGLYQQSEKILNETILNLPKIKSGRDDQNITVSKIYQLQAINAGIFKNYKSLEKNIAESTRFLKTSDNENTLIGIENKIFSAVALLNQNKIGEAKILVENALKTVEKHPEYNFHYALSQITFAKIFFAQGKYYEAVDALTLAHDKIQNLGYLPLEAKIYEELSKNYSALKDSDRSQNYQNLSADLKTKLAASKKEGINYIVKLVENYEVKNLEFQTEVEKRSLRNLLLIISFLILATFGYLIFEIIKGGNLKKQISFFKKFSKTEMTLETAGKNTAIITDDLEKTEDEEEKEIKKSPGISKEKELDILNKLTALENSDRFLSKNMSLATLSGQLETNTKYLSEVINNNKGKNFNGYINELRINHIAFLLKNNPEYLNYKVSYLADISGFSSHSSFATIFKSVTGMSPNTYIQQINKSR